MAPTTCNVSGVENSRRFRQLPTGGKVLTATFMEGKKNLQKVRVQVRENSILFQFLAKKLITFDFQIPNKIINFE